MFKIKEILLIILFSILLGILIKLRTDISTGYSNLLNAILIGIITMFVILGLNVITKKITARYLDTSIEIRPWKFKQFWFKSRAHLRRAFPAGIFFPILTTFFSMGYLVWLAVMDFEPSPLSSRATKRYGLYRFSELTESHIALIAASGVIINLLLAIPGYIFGFTELAKLSIYFACWNLLPLGSLDGSKIFFGSRILWFALALIALIFLSYALFLV